MKKKFKQFSEQHVKELETTLEKIVSEETDAETLKEAMLYSLRAGGKRFRPMLYLAVVDAFGTIRESDYKIASAIEMIHTYSLIHDDLPSMDNDDVRRGKPTNHKVFGEAIAILAGDGLLSLAFLTVAKNTEKMGIIQDFAAFSGVGKMGMVAGQVLDIEGEEKESTLEELKNIHKKKTGGLILLSVKAALHRLGMESKDLESFAFRLGLSFQIRDDILDVTLSSDELGKTARKDMIMDKSTYVKLLQLEGAKSALNSELNLAESSLQSIEKRVGLENLYSLIESLRLDEGQ
ncbi:MAG: polyprenyl synthetase family protein [Streptococcaceae bacterium]|nr:polyprenyl synthetase family protein [Streptococcaceae bacterium]